MSGREYNYDSRPSTGVPPAYCFGMREHQNLDELRTLPAPFHLIETIAVFYCIYFGTLPDIQAARKGRNWTCSTASSIPIPLQLFVRKTDFLGFFIKQHIDIFSQICYTSTRNVAGKRRQLAESDCSGLFNACNVLYYSSKVPFYFPANKFM